MAYWPVTYFVRKRRLFRRYFVLGLPVVNLFCIILFVRYMLYETVNRSSVSAKPFASDILKNNEAEHIAGVHEINGMMNEHVWWNLSETDVDVLRDWPQFANLPDKRSFITDFHISLANNTTNMGQRIFGYIIPEVSAKYAFAITSSGKSELWLGPHEHPACSKLIARVYSPNAWASTAKGDYNKYHGQISSEIALYSGKKYYIESLSVSRQSSDETFVAVYWRETCALNSTFQIISSKYLSPFDESLNPKISPYLCNSGNGRNCDLQKRKSNLLKFLSLPLIDREEYTSLMPTCPYSPSFLVRRKLKSYQGVRLTKESLVFPQDDTDMSDRVKMRKWTLPNPIINKNRVECLVDMFTDTLRKRNILFKRIHKVIQKPDAKKGDRFLLDLEVALNLHSNQTLRLSEHVYQKHGSDSVCLLEGMIWNNSATVYFIIPVKDQGKWIHHFIKQVTAASLLTGDTNFHVILSDFESTDIDLEKAFNTSLLSSRHTVVQLSGKFYKTLAINKAVELVPNAYDIVFLFDLHIDVPTDLMDSVRKNTIAGRMTYFPVVGRLDCKSNPVEHQGFWERLGFGLMAIFKSDWTRLGGMNTLNYTYKWGGEDWDLVDRILMMSLEVERIQHPGLYHHCHSRKGMWS